MSDESNCPNCGEPVARDSVRCPRCGHNLVAGRGLAIGGLRPLAPVVFVVAGLAVGAGATVLAGLPIGLPLGLFGGGLGVWVLERGRRLLQK